MKKKSYLGKQWVFSEYFFSGFLSFCILSYCLATLYRASAYRHSAAFIRVRWRYCICVIDEYSLEVCCAARRLTGVRAPTTFDASKRLCRECLSTCLVFFFSRFVFWKLSLLIQCIPTSCAYIHAVVPCVGLRLRKTAEIYLWTLHDTPKYSQLIQLSLIHVETKETAVWTEKQKQEIGFTMMY